MAFTDNSDLYGAVNEEGINRVVRHLKRLRPSLFNYGTQFIADHPELLCHPIEVDQMVHVRNNPLLTVESPLPIFGTNNLLNMNYCVQLVDARIDFHRSNAIKLPPQFGDELPPQHFALSAKACAGLGCPDERLTDYLELFMEGLHDAISVEGLIDGTESVNLTHRPKGVKLPDPITIPTRKMQCFCLEVFALCHIETRQSGGRYVFVPKMDQIEIVDIAPDGLENSIECYAAQVVRLGLLPRIRIALEKIVFDQLKIVNIGVKPAAGVANNPAIEDDQLKVFIDMEVS